jgi:hypothetical protein
MQAETGQDSAGRPLTGAAALAHAKAAEREQRAAERREDYPAVARGLCALATRVTGIPGPDALRAVVGRDDAVRILRAAGHSASPVVREWSDFDRERQRQADGGRQQTEAMWAADPTHHPRYLAALRAGASMTELGMLAAALSKEYDATRPPTAQERYELQRREYDRNTAASQQRSQPLEPGQRGPDQRMPEWQQVRPASAQP